MKSSFELCLNSSHMGCVSKTRQIFMLCFILLNWNLQEKALGTWIFKTYANVFWSLEQAGKLWLRATEFVAPSA